MCLMIEGQEGVTWDDWVRLARLVEETGLEGLFRSDHYTAIIRDDANRARCMGDAGRAPRSPSASASARSSRRRPSATRACSRAWLRPSTTSRAGASTWAWARAGTSGHLAHGFPFLDGRQRFDLFAEQVEIVVRSWAGSASTTRARPTSCATRPRCRARSSSPTPPLVLGGSVKSRFAALALHASEVNTLGATNDELRERKTRLDQACADAGRDPATLGYSVMTACFVGADRATCSTASAFIAVGRRHRPRELLAGAATAGSPAPSTRSPSESRSCVRSA